MGQKKEKIEFLCIWGFSWVNWWEMGETNPCFLLGVKNKKYSLSAPWEQLLKDSNNSWLCLGNPSQKGLLVPFGTEKSLFCSTFKTKCSSLKLGQQSLSQKPLKFPSTPLKFHSPALAPWQENLDYFIFIFYFFFPRSVRKIWFFFPFWRGRKSWISLFFFSSLGAGFTAHDSPWGFPLFLFLFFFSRVYF